MRASIAARRVLVACAVLLSGNLCRVAVAAPIPLIDFGSVPVGTSTTRTVNVTLLPSTLPRTFSSSFRTDFQLGAATCDSTRVNCSIEVTFSPQAPGLRQDAVTVKDDANNFLGQVYLAGIGEAPQVSFVPGVLSTPAPYLGADGLAIDPADNIYVGNVSARIVNKIAAGDGSVSTVAGSIVSFSDALALDGAGNLYISDSGSNLVQKVDAQTGLVTRVAGNYTAGYSGDGGPALSAQLHNPREIVVDKAGNVYISDTANHAIRKVDSTTGIITTVAGNGIAGYSGDGGPGANAQLRFPRGLALDVSGNLFIVDAANYRVRKLDAQTQIISTVAGNGTDGYSGDGGLAVECPT